MNYSSYVWGSSKSYLDYLQDKNYLNDLNKDNRALVMDVRKDLRELAFDQNTLINKGFELMQLPMEELRDLNYGIGEIAAEQAETRELIAKTLDAGIERVSYDLKKLKANFEKGVGELNATFQWCCSNLLSELGGMKDSISELIKLVKSPMQTAALEHFNNARTAFENELYPEAMEELHAAINGVPGVSAGYKMEWRVYQLLGLIRLGFDGCDISMVNLAEAEENFLKAARYAKSQDENDAAQCLMSAGWTAYCQGSFDNAILHLNKAVELNEALWEAWFLLGKIHGAKQDSTAFEYLRKAARRDPLYILKAISDENYTWDENGLKKCIDQVKKDYYNFYYDKITEYLQSNEFRNVKGYEKEVKAICKANMLKDWNTFRKDLDRFMLKLQDYVEIRKQMSGPLMFLKKRLQRISEVVAHEDFPLWKIKNPLPSFMDRFMKLQTEFDNNDFSNPEWSSFNTRLTKLCEEVDHYKERLRDTVTMFYRNKMLPIDRQIVELNKQIAKKTASLQISGDLSIAKMKGELTCNKPLRKNATSYRSYK